MSKAKSGQSRRKQDRKRKKRQQRLKELTARSKTSVSTKTDERLYEIHRLITDREFDAAKDALLSLEKRKPNNPAVAEMLILLYQANGDAQSGSVAARKMLHLTPDDPDVIAVYAQESMRCGRVSIAFVQYQSLVDGWPHHSHARKADELQKACESESRKRFKDIQKRGFTDLEFDDGGLDLIVLHETAIEKLSIADFKGTIETCEQVLEIEPRFISARNNLASCRFQIGELERALSMVRETRKLVPGNRYAQALSGRIEFLCGNVETANQIADAIMSDLPVEQDALLAALETLSYLGRDEDILRVYEKFKSLDLIDPAQLAHARHFEAYAVARLGDMDKAISIWKECMKELPSGHEAGRNILDLIEGEGHCPWAEPCSKWIPRALLQEITALPTDHKSGMSQILKAFPHVRLLIPALLDRGDPGGREFALIVATHDQSPEMIETLRQFAFGRQGPHSMRQRAMQRLKELGVAMD